MPYHIIKKIKLISKGSSTYLPIFAIDLEDNKTWNFFKLYVSPFPQISGEVKKLLHSDGTVSDTIEESFNFQTETKCDNTYGGDTHEERVLLLPKELVRAYCVEETMAIELMLNEVIYNFTTKEILPIYKSKTVEGPKDIIPIILKDNGECTPILNGSTTPFKEGKSFQNANTITEGNSSLMFNPIFKSRNFKTKRTTCFVLMPFRPNFERLYKDHIKPTLEKVGYEVLKANDLYTTSPIIEDIWEQINKSKLIVADVTGKNANVFYELGIAHAIGKDTIIITQNDDDVPFDLKHLRYFKYDDNEAGWSHLDNCIEKVLTQKK
jgi:hypothetical protein